MAEDFEMQQQLRPTIKRAVFHGIISFYPGENPGNEKMIEIAKEYLEKIEFVNEFKLLGVTIDYKLNFSAHIKKLCKSVNSKAFLLSKSHRLFLSRNHIVFSLITSAQYYLNFLFKRILITVPHYFSGLLPLLGIEFDWKDASVNLSIVFLD